MTSSVIMVGIVISLVITLVAFGIIKSISKEEHWWEINTII